ncbi:SH2 domain-containing protein 4A isoform X2 [Ambystoma mexicanum]|uniref:SH2 domain-containing protein 4A isoform X2 n=1 Tax=Ambystoma mexicanum TaxID=8296 RepID=UPI0037E7A6F9
MLKQILADMYIDPELLLELSEEQKQILFYKMREEQIRRWKERESTYEEIQRTKMEAEQRKSKKTSVKWRLGADNEVWVWVMGEHHSDKSYDVISEEIMKAQELHQSPKENEELRKAQVEKISNKLEGTSLHSQQNVVKVWENEEASRKMIKQILEGTRNENPIEQQKTDAETQELIVMKIEEEDVKRGKDNTKEIYMNWNDPQEDVKSFEKEDSEWQASLRKSKAADERRRSIARSAKEDYKRLSMQAIEKGKVSTMANNFGMADVKRPPIPPKPKPRDLKTKVETINRRQAVKRSTSSSTRENIILWFKEEQLPLKAGLNKSGDSIAPWFHGIISRAEAEEILNAQNTGSFLIRVSEKIKGYVLSYTSGEGHKHFMIDASNNAYGFLGVDQMQHSTLADLVAYHQEEPITCMGKELLLYPCEQPENMCNYNELFE